MTRDDYKLCIDCGLEERLKPHYRCHSCFNKKRRETRDVNKTNRQNKESRQRNYVARRKYVYKTRYKITEDQYQQMLIDQNNSCAICGINQDRLTIRMSIDHDHNCCPGLYSCGNCLRGLLCRACNLSLGGLKDSEEVLQSAINYLRYHSTKGEDLDES